MDRVWQLVLIVSILGLSWLGMMVVHEAGHVLAAWLDGARVQRVVLHPLAISRTDVTQPRHPVLVAWGGPLVGALVPLGALGVAKLRRSPYDYLPQFFAGFCLLANGLYLGVGSFSGVGDAGDLLRYGARRWMLVAFGAVTAPLGLVLWNGIGPCYGLGEARGRVSRGATIVTLGLLLAVILVEVLVDSR